MSYFTYHKIKGFNMWYISLKLSKISFRDRDIIYAHFTKYDAIAELDRREVISYVVGINERDLTDKLSKEYNMKTMYVKGNERMMAQYIFIDKEDYLRAIEYLDSRILMKVIAE